MQTANSADQISSEKQLKTKITKKSKKTIQIN